MKTPWTKIPESNHIAEVGSQGRSMTWGESLVSDGVGRSVTVSNWGVVQTSRHPFCDVYVCSVSFCSCTGPVHCTGG
jgi:hypothetical protein